MVDALYFDTDALGDDRPVDLPRNVDSFDRADGILAGTSTDGSATYDPSLWADSGLTPGGYDAVVDVVIDGNAIRIDGTTPGLVFAGVGLFDDNIGSFFSLTFTVGQYGTGSPAAPPNNATIFVASQFYVVLYSDGSMESGPGTPVLSAGAVAAGDRVRLELVPAGVGFATLNVYVNGSLAFTDTGVGGLDPPEPVQIWWTTDGTGPQFELTDFAVAEFTDRPQREIAHRDAAGSVLQVTNGPTWDSWFPQPALDGTSGIVFVRTPPDPGLGTGPHDPPDYAQTSLWHIDDTWTTVTLLVDQTIEGWAFLATPHWTPDSAQLVVARAPTGDPIRPTVLTLAGAVVADVDNDAGNALTDPAFHPDPDIGGAGIARLIYCRAGSLVRRDWDGAAPVGARTTVFDATTWDPNSSVPGRVWCFDPIYRPFDSRVFFLADFNGYTPGSPGTRDWGVGACESDGTSPYRVTPDDHIYSKPEVSIDGLWVYCHRFNGNWEIVRVPSDGTAVATPGLVEVLYDVGAYSEYPVVAPEAPEPENTPPVAEDRAVTVCADEAEEIALDASDADLDPLTCTIDTPPTNGSLGAVVDCAVTYTPDPGYVGPDSFTWHANDGTDDSGTATVTITVEDCEEPPPDDSGGSENAEPSEPPPGPCGDPPLHVAPTSAVLGPASRCAETRVEIRRRGSHAPILQLDSGDEMIERYEWNRAMGATAPAQVVVPLGGSVDAACCRVLGSLTPWRDELLIYRDEDLVWEGPLHVAREVRDRVVLDARDPSAWAEVRRVRRRHTFVERDAAEAWAQVFADGLSADWPAGLELRMTRACALVTRTVEPLPYLLAAGPMGEIAADGVDWTALGSTILVGGTCTNVILDVTLYDDAFAGSPEVAPDGAAYASWVGVNGEGDVVAEAGGIDPDIGLVERVFDDRGARDERTARQHAQRSWAVRGRDGVPVIVSMAQDVALSGRAPLGVNDLVCGRMLRVAIQPACREVATLMRLVAVKVTGDADGEKIVPTFEPVGDAGGLNG